MLQKEEQSLRVQILEALSSFIHKFKYPLWALLAAVIVFTVTYFIWSERGKRLTEDSTILAEEVEQIYIEWMQEEDDELKKNREEELMSQIDTIIRHYSRQYGGQRVLFIRANVYFEKSDWQNAADDFSELSKMFPQSYLSPLSLFNAAICYEEMNNLQGALDLYDQITEKYKDSHLMAHTLFSKGRINEELQEYTEAYAAYTQLEEDFLYSQWSILGKNRIIALKVQGMVEQ